MNYQKVIDYKLQMLIDLMLTDGVSPSDLSNNIFEKDYVSITFYKKSQYVIGKLDFYENENILQNIQMIYTYTNDKKLIRIEEIHNEVRHLLWDREKREDELIEELLYFMKCSYTYEQIEKFIMSLPQNLRMRILECISTLSA